MAHNFRHIHAPTSNHTIANTVVSAESTNYTNYTIVVETLAQTQCRRSLQHEGVAFAAVQCPDLILVIVSEVVEGSTGQRRIGVVDKLHHLLHLVSLREAQSDTLARWFDFSLTVGHVELSKIDALKASGDRHVTSTADMLAIVDGWIVFVGVGVLVYRDDLSIDLVKAEAKLSSSATSANEIISGLVLKCALRNDVGNKYDRKIMVIFSPVRCNSMNLSFCLMVTVG